jgi:hypothetical protein
LELIACIYSALKLSTELNTSTGLNLKPLLLFGLRALRAGGGHSLLFEQQ